MKFIKIIITIIVIIIFVISALYNKSTKEEVSPKKWKSEKITQEVFTELIEEFGGDKRNISYNKRHDFLRNPETGRKLELDMMYSDGIMNIAVEYQGKQHTEFPNYFYPDTELGRSNFEALQRRDRCKKKLCEENNVCLIEVPYTCDTCDYLNNRYVYNSQINITEKRRRIKEYLIPRINQCLINFQD